MCALRHRHRAMHRTVAKRGFERDIVSLFFVLRTLVEGAPQLRVR